MSNKTDGPTHLEEIIDKTLSYLENLNPDTDEFARTVDQLDKLTKMLPAPKEPLIKPEALIGLIGNLAGITAILGYEHAHVVTSKALGFVPKIHI